MKRFLAILAFLLSGSLASAQCADTPYGNGFVCHQQKGNFVNGSATSVVATMGATTTAGRQMVLFASACATNDCVGATTGMTLTPTSGGGDTFVATPGTPYILTDAAGNDFGMGAWVVTSATATTTFTVTFNGTVYYPTLYVSEWTGIAATSPIDVSATNTVTTGTSMSVALTTVNPVELVIGWISLFNGGAITPGTGYTEIGEDVTYAQHEAKSINASGSNPCSWTWGSTTIKQGICMGLKAAYPKPKVWRAF